MKDILKATVLTVLMVGILGGIGVLGCVLMEYAQNWNFDWVLPLGILVIIWVSAYKAVKDGF